MVSEVNSNLMNEKLEIIILFYYKLVLEFLRENNFTKGEREAT